MIYNFYGIFIHNIYYKNNRIVNKMDLSLEDNRCCVGAIVFQVILLAFILMVFAKVLFPSEPFSQKNKRSTQNCILCECSHNKDNKCETHMCQKIQDSIWVLSARKCHKAHLMSQSMGFACNCDGEWNTSDFFSDILKNESEIKGKITKYLEKNRETKINEISVKRMLGKDWPI